MVYLDLLLKMERSFHPNLMEYTKCLKKNLGTSSITMKAVLEGRQAYKPSIIRKIFTWAKSGVQVLISLVILFLDILLDVLLVVNYWNNYQGIIIYFYLH